MCVSSVQDQVRFVRKKAGRRVLSHINRFSGTKWCFRWALFWENVLGGTKWNVGCDVWRGDRRRGVGVAVGDGICTFSKYVILGIVNSK